MSTLSITILVCAAAMPKPACNPDNAIAVVRPNASLYAEYSGLPGCLSFGEKFAASLSYMDPDDAGSQQAYPKILCRLGVPAVRIG